MDTEQAKRVQAGDVAVYRRTRHRVLAVHLDGFWAPYFELEGAGVVGHALVDSVEIRPAQAAPRTSTLRRVSRSLITRAGGLATPELGIQASDTFPRCPLR
jgi:hypothetical protein